MDTTTPWWKTAKNDVHSEVFSFISDNKLHQTYKETDFLTYLRLYGAQSYMGFSPTHYSTKDPRESKYRLTLNIVNTICDSATSKLSKNKPKPMFLTDGGDQSMQYKAKNLNYFCEGQFYQTGIYEKAATALLDATVFGSGFLKIYRLDNKIHIDRVLPNEIYIDDAESIYGEPRQLHQVKYIHKDVLKSKFPKHATAIETAAEGVNEYWGAAPSENIYMVKVVESWRLPVGKKDKGRHTISIESETLLDEEYTKEYFPFVKMDWGKRLLGWFGRGIPEMLKDVQFEINKTLRTIQASLHLTSIPKILVENGSKIVKAHLNNQIGGIITYSGTLPTPMTLGQVNPQLFDHVDRLYSRAFEIVGISQLSAQSQKPAGLNSGKALRTYSDIESERFIATSRRYEQLFLDACKQMIDLAKEIAEEDGDYAVMVPEKNNFRTIKWKDVNLEESQYIMQAFPTSQLPATPAGKFAYVQELLQGGFISKEEGLKLLDLPDTSAIVDRKLAAQADIDMMIEKMVESGEYSPPDPLQNLALGVQSCKDAYLLYRSRDVDEEKLELLRTWAVEAQKMLEMSMQPPVEEAPQMAQAEPLPTSDLLPQV